ncbi:MAG: hypothetical protein LUG13_02520 [Oscillospiraceae bacterium]|nr:hypothetical protein [Oscillospiraceae bacterium]
MNNEEKILEMLAQMQTTMVTKDELAAMEKRILTETNHNMKVLLDLEVQPRLKILAEGIMDIQEKLVPRSRVDELDVNGNLKMHKKGGEKMYKSGIRDLPYQTGYCWPALSASCTPCAL